jgi:hypothetical protein
MGSKKIPLFRNSPFVIAQLSAGSRTAGPKMPLQESSFGEWPYPGSARAYFSV